MNINLFLSYYTDTNTERQEELQYCIERNITNPIFKRVICLTERPTYYDLFKETAHYPNDINVIANSDMFFDDSLKKILNFDWNAGNGSNYCLALSRWDIKENGNCELHKDRGSQDVWIFKGTAYVSESKSDFYLGKPGCDNRIAFVLKEQGYRVVNPCMTIKSYHLHKSNIHNYSAKETIIGYHLMLSQCTLDDVHNTEYWERTLDQVEADIKEKLDQRTDVVSVEGENLLDNIFKTTKDKLSEILESSFKTAEKEVFGGNQITSGDNTDADWQHNQAIKQFKSVNDPLNLFNKKPSHISQTGKPKILHIALMVGNSGFARELRKSASEYVEIDYQSVKRETGIHELNQFIQDTARQFKPDLIFCQLQESGIIYRDTFKVISKEAFTIVWTGDARQDTPSYLLELINIDNLLISFSNETDVQKVKQIGGNSAYLQIGIDPEIYNPAKQRNDNVPKICFVGHHYSNLHFPLSQERLDMIDMMRNTYLGDFGLFGGGYIYNVRRLDQKEESEVYANAVIGVNYSHFNYKRYTSDRLLKMLSVGIFVISHNYPGIEKDFEIDKHLVVFNNLKELKEKIDYYLVNHDARNKIARAGYELAISKFTFKNMVNNIISLYSENKLK